MVRLATRSSWVAFSDVLWRGEGFKTSGALSGRPGGAVDVGLLPREFRGAVSGAVYVVFSYGTPIAWRGGDGVWVVPDVWYSATTSRHQGVISVAVDHLG